MPVPLLNLIERDSKDLQRKRQGGNTKSDPCLRLTSRTSSLTLHLTALYNHERTRDTLLLRNQSCFLDIIGFDILEYAFLCIESKAFQDSSLTELVHVYLFDTE
ncbi:hypothetical protein TIFTF001_046224 [Ficus carica]|uniref:Uncharacterized protein n=1 Tax=Ficus carica TaxID=3494 RepID=A0AA88D676_FICCA|nr:hypothetical protein TIFTF001_046224 [Ficus carica]